MVDANLKLSVLIYCNKKGSQNVRKKKWKKINNIFGYVIFFFNITEQK